MLIATALPQCENHQHLGSKVFSRCLVLVFMCGFPPWLKVTCSQVLCGIYGLTSMKTKTILRVNLKFSQLFGKSPAAEKYQSTMSTQANPWVFTHVLPVAWCNRDLLFRSRPPEASSWLSRPSLARLESWYQGPTDPSCVLGNMFFKATSNTAQKGSLVCHIAMQ